MRYLVAATTWALVLSLAACALAAPSGDPSSADVAAILNEVGAEAARPEVIVAPWWTELAAEPIAPTAQQIPVSIDDLVQLAVSYSADLSVARYVPSIRETAVVEADAEFDWHQFIDSIWDDTSDPIGNSLTVGRPSATRFRDHNLTVDAGLRRRTTSGADFEVFQQFGHQSNNSSFFVPNDQGTARMVFSFTQPLLQRHGRAYNTSLIMLAQIDVGTAYDEVRRQLQTHLLEVSRAYWGLYLERAALVQRVRLYMQTSRIVEQLQGRQAIDALRTQLISAQAALEARKSELIRARAAVKNAETRLRTLINAPMLAGDPEAMELRPLDRPTTNDVATDLFNEFTIAMQNRPEVAAALKQIRAASVRLRMADNEVLPMLNLVTETYVAGLQGRSRVGEAWLDQFREGEPSYSIGLQFEVPIYRRAARARLSRRELEISQLREEYRSVMEKVRAEVEVAVREVRTAYRELHAKQRAQEAALQEAKTLDIRWRRLPDPGNTAALLLESLLAALERVTEREYEFAKAQMTYNLALVNLRKTNGTLMQMEPLKPEDLVQFQNAMDGDVESSSSMEELVPPSPAP